MHLNESKIQNNIDEFVEQHGVEGFFRLYLQEYLFELLYEEVNAASGDPKQDSGIQLHFSNQVTSDKELQQFKEQLRNQCVSRADRIVERIKNNDTLQPLFENGDVELLQRDETEEMITTAMHDIVEEWEEDQ